MESSLTNFTHGTAVEVRTMDKFQPGQVWAGLSWVYRCVLGGGGGGGGGEESDIHFLPIPVPTHQHLPGQWW